MVDKTQMFINQSGIIFGYSVIKTFNIHLTFGTNILNTFAI